MKPFRSKGYHPLPRGLYLMHIEHYPSQKQVEAFSLYNKMLRINESKYFILYG